MQRALAVSLEGMKETVKLSPEDNKDAKNTEKEEEKRPTYPPLPEEPKGDRNLLCRIGVRLPNGRRCQRNFLRTDPIQVNTVSLELQLHSKFCLYLLSYMIHTLKP